MKLKQTLVAAALSGLLSGIALAQTPPPAPAAAPAPAAEPAPPFSVNVGLATSYIYRGLNQSDYKPALQIGADYVSPSGFYVGVWGSSIRWVKDFGLGTANAEFDIYGGYKGEAGPIGYDVGVLQYVYNGSVTAGAVRANTTELYVIADGARFAFVATVDIELGVGSTQTEVLDPTNTRTPNADVETAGTHIISTNLQRRFVIRLVQASIDVGGCQTYIHRKRGRWLGRGCWGGGGRGRWCLRERDA